MNYDLYLNNLLNSLKQGYLLKIKTRATRFEGFLLTGNLAEVFKITDQKVLANLVTHPEVTLQKQVNANTAFYWIKPAYVSEVSSYFGHSQQRFNTPPVEPKPSDFTPKTSVFTEKVENSLIDFQQLKSAVKLRFNSNNPCCLLWVSLGYSDLVATYLGSLNIYPEYLTTADLIKLRQF